MLDSNAVSSGPVSLSELTLFVCHVAFGKNDCGEDKSKKSRLHETLRETQELLGGSYIAEFFPWMAWLNKFNGFETRLEMNFRELDESYEEVNAEHLDPRRPETERFFPSAFQNRCNRSTYSSAFRNH
ncbi:cytochrome p450 71a9 [Quercus suber]|uniref:Cytochrome p450 71a9 n=1 Tax=Quercus suber TaxID=58331 RepID=A0AAW0K4L1_QUESU